MVFTCAQHSTLYVQQIHRVFWRICTRTWETSWLAWFQFLLGSQQLRTRALPMEMCVIVCKQSELLAFKGMSLKYAEDGALLVSTAKNAIAR